MSNLISIKSLIQEFYPSTKSKILVIPPNNIPSTINSEELIKLATPHNFTNNNGNSLILRSKNNSIRFSFYSEEQNNVRNIYKYNNIKILTDEYNTSEGFPFTFEENDKIKELSLMSTTDISLMTHLRIFSGKLYALDISACPNLKSIIFPDSTINMEILDLSWNQNKSNNCIINDISYEYQDPLWTCNYLIDNYNNKSIILNRVKN